MRSYNFFGGIILLAGFFSCELRANADMDVAKCDAIHLSDSEKQLQNDEEISLITSVYGKFVFATDTSGDNNPADYFTSRALKKLQDDYDFDCEEGSCYAYYALRTEKQDSKPGAEDVSYIYSIDPIGDGWYAVSYLDMGWSGMTRIKIVDGKVDDYRCSE
jgi:hypothetical protein